MPIPTVALAPDLVVSRLVTGLWQVADLERDGTTLDPDAGAAAMAAHLAASCTTFDMADHYGSAELVAGRFRATAAAGRDDVRLLTKWVPTPGPVTRADVRAAVDRARARLGVDRIDLLQFHAWRYADPSWLDALWLLAEEQAEGRIAHLGLTNVDTAHLRVAVASGIPIVSNQVCCSLLDARATGAMAAYAREHRVGLLAYGALAGGFLAERWLGAPEPAPDALATWSEMKYRRFIDAAGGWDAYQRVLAACDRVARRLGVPIAHVALRWTLDQPGIAAVIVGARLGRTVHAEANARVFDVPLDADAHAELAEARAALRPIPGDCGDEYRRAPFLTASGDLSHHVDAFPPPYAVTRRPDGRARAASGTVWEDMAGYSRAVRVGDTIHVSGTTATHGPRLVGGRDAAAQAHAVIDKLEGAIVALGGRLDDVVRTRVYVRDLADWEAVARATASASPTCARRTRSCRPRSSGPSTSWRSRPRRASAGERRVTSG